MDELCVGFRVQLGVGVILQRGAVSKASAEPSAGLHLWNQVELVGGDVLSYPSGAALKVVGSFPSLRDGRCSCRE